MNRLRINKKKSEWYKSKWEGCETQNIKWKLSISASKVSTWFIFFQARDPKLNFKPLVNHNQDITKLKQRKRLLSWIILPSLSGGKSGSTWALTLFVSMQMSIKTVRTMYPKRFIVERHLATLLMFYQRLPALLGISRLKKNTVLLWVQDHAEASGKKVVASDKVIYCWSWLLTL